jgi:hypothetical protein
VTRLVELVVGTLMIAVTWLTVVRTVLIPRGNSSHIVRGMLRAWSSGVQELTRRVSPTYRARLMEIGATTCLLAFLGFWLAVQIVGFGLISMALLAPEEPSRALGILRTGGTEPAVVGLVAELSVLMLLVVFCAYLSRLSAAYGRRESMAVRLAGLATREPDAEMVIANHVRSGFPGHLDQLMAEWASWLAEIRFTHTAYPVLVYYRAAARICWLRSAVIMLDTAALVDALAPNWAPPNTRALLRTGIDCLQTVAGQVGVRPRPSMTSLQGREDVAFSDTMYVAVAAGLVAERDPDDAREAFQRWRLEYAPYAAAISENLAYEVFHVVSERANEPGAVTVTCL